jgi:hypothetical protein
MKKDTKPYDTAFKDLAEQEPELLLRLMGALPPGATVKALPREVSAPMLAADQPYEVTAGERRFIAHLEEQTRWADDVPERVTAYQAIFWANHRLPVHSYVLLLTPRGLPKDLPASCVVDAGGLWLKSHFTIVKAWELPAAEAWAAGSPNLLPFIPLMAGGDAFLEPCARALGKVRKRRRQETLALHFLVMGGLRYNREHLFDLIGRLTMIPIQALRESSVYQFILQEGKREMLIDMLQRMAHNRFPGVEIKEEVERVNNLEALENLCINLHMLPDEAALHAQLEKLAANGQTFTRG